MKLARTIAAIAIVSSTACGTTPSWPLTAWQSASRDARTEAQLRADRARCALSAREAANTHQKQSHTPTLTNGSNLGAGFAVVMAESRVLDTVRERAFLNCMAAAGWQLGARESFARLPRAGMQMPALP